MDKRHLKKSPLIREVPMEENRNNPRTPDLNDARLWKTLDTVLERLMAIEYSLAEMIRLEEKVNNHHQTLNRYGDRLDTHEQRLRESEVWQAQQGDRSHLDRKITKVSEKVDELRDELQGLDTKASVNQGQKEVSAHVLKWVAGILGALLIWQLTSPKAEADEFVISNMPPAKHRDK